MTKPPAESFFRHLAIEEKAGARQLRWSLRKQSSLCSCSFKSFIWLIICTHKPMSQCAHSEYTYTDLPVQVNRHGDTVLVYHKADREYPIYSFVIPKPKAQGRFNSITNTPSLHLRMSVSIERLGVFVLTKSR